MNDEEFARLQAFFLGGNGGGCSSPSSSFFLSDVNLVSNPVGPCFEETITETLPLEAAQFSTSGSDVVSSEIVKKKKQRKNGKNSTVQIENAKSSIAQVALLAEEDGKTENLALSSSKISNDKFYYQRNKYKWLMRRITCLERATREVEQPLIQQKWEEFLIEDEKIYYSTGEERRQKAKEKYDRDLIEKHRLVRMLPEREKFEDMLRERRREEYERCKKELAEAQNQQN